MNERGKYIVVEGGEFSGKTTQLERLKQRIAATELGASFLYTREPGGTPVGEDIRKIIFFPNTAQFPSAELPDETALQLFTANRVYNWRHQIEPALKKGINVLSDRNWFSTLSYQGARGAITEQAIIDTTAYSLPADYMQPDLAFVLTIPPEERKRRQKSTGLQDGAVDAFEALDESFHDRAAEIYNQTIENFGAVGVDGTRSVDEIHEFMWLTLEALLRKG